MKLISLLSGGIDSPVSSYIMMKKADIIFVHFHNQTLQTENVKNKVIKTAQKACEKAGKKSKLYLVPFRELQQELIKTVGSKFRMIVYRRIMFKIAEKILLKEKAQGFVTGDNIGQVASQTLDNLDVIYNATKYPIFSPLLSFDKIEIIKKAEKIGTFSISIEPYPDCCSFMIAKHPETKACLNNIKKIESNIDIDRLVSEVFKKTIIINVS